MAPRLTTEPAVEPSDEALMARLQAGEDAALAALMARWELPVKGFLLRLGVPTADVEDVAQETFVRLYQQRKRFAVGARLKPWLLTLAANLGRSRLRWRWRRREESAEALTDRAGAAAETMDDAVPTGAEFAEQAERAVTVRRAVERLPSKLRGAIVCVAFESLSHAEAAQVLGCSVKAVETRLHRARAQLRTTLSL